MNLKDLTNRFGSNAVQLFLLSIVIFGCSGDKKQKQLPPQNVTYVQPVVKTVPIFNEFVGQVYGKVDIPIRARVEGYLEGIHFNEGFRVNKGQLLYSIDSQPFEAEVTAKRSNLREAQTELVRAENELKRYEPLVKINAVSKSDYDATLAQRDAALASEKAARASLEISQINLSYAKIKSPVDGIIGKTKAKIGEFVGRDPNPVILNTISNVSFVRVEFFLAENEYLRFAQNIKINEDGTVERQDNSEESNLELILSNGTVHPHKGKIDFLDREVDPMTGAILVQASFPNPSRILKPGQYAKVRAQVFLVTDAILVPQRCVTELQGQYSLRVVKDDNTIEIKQVTPGERIGDMWLITEGITTTDKIVMDGIQKVRSGMTVTAKAVEFKSKFDIK